MIDTASINEAGEDLMHFTGIRIRVNGNGNLIPTFQSLDDVDSVTLTPFIINSTTAREPFKLANFISQRAFLRLETQQINEIFRINRVIVYAKPQYSQFVGE